MKVKDLIKALKKMPQNLEVGIAHHDNYEWEVAAWSGHVSHHIKEDYTDLNDQSGDLDSKRMFRDQPKEWVTIHC